jgi:hypothetical protein
VFSDVERRVGEGDINCIRDVWCVGQLEAKRLRSVPDVFFDLKLGDGDKVMQSPRADRGESAGRMWVFLSLNNTESVSVESARL